MESTTTLSLPLKTRITLSILSTATDLVRRKDGTVNRRLFNLIDYRVPSSPKPTKGVKSHDVVVDPSRNLWFRVYVPTQQHAEENLPVIVFFHGGGFVFLAPDVKIYDTVCRQFARKLCAVVVSVDYRLAPEHPYPAQHDDCFDVLRFLDDDESRSKWLPGNTDISRCFLAGDSAGGNLAHHVAQRACELNFKQLKVNGVMAIQPFFGGEERTNSEKELEGTPLVSLNRTDWYWKAFMSPGNGYNRDHPIINVSGPNAVDISNIDFPPTIVVVAGFDCLRDWQIRYYKWLKNSGKEAYLVDYSNMFHAFYLFPEFPESKQLISELKEFIHKVLNKGNYEKDKNMRANL